MKFDINEDIDVYTLVMNIKKLKAENIAKGNAKLRGRKRNIAPWIKAWGSQSETWLALDKAYEWYLQDNNPSSPQAYRRLSETLNTYSPKARASCQNMISWIEAHGNPCLNEEWLQWQDSYVMAEY